MIKMGLGIARMQIITTEIKVGVVPARRLVYVHNLHNNLSAKT